MVTVTAATVLPNTGAYTSVVSQAEQVAKQADQRETPPQFFERVLGSVKAQVANALLTDDEIVQVNATIVLLEDEAKTEVPDYRMLCGEVRELRDSVRELLEYRKIVEASERALCWFNQDQADTLEAQELISSGLYLVNGQVPTLEEMKLRLPAIRRDQEEASSGARVRKGPSAKSRNKKAEKSANDRAIRNRMKSPKGR